MIKVMIMFENLSTDYTTQLQGLTNSELLDLREEISRRTKTLTDINLEEELVAQYLSTKSLLKEAYDDDTESSSQKAALINSCNSILKELSKTQSEIHNAERVKIMESTMIEVLEKLNPKACQDFLTLYESSLESNLS